MRQPDQAKATQTSNLAGAVFNGGIAGVDLSDGIGLDDLMGFASFLMGNKQ